MKNINYIRETVIWNYNKMCNILKKWNKNMKFFRTIRNIIKKRIIKKQIQSIRYLSQIRDNGVYIEK